ncbi:MAG: cytochrome b/b6 domain-containing protein [Alphaproteobacteria bacterium]|nr:cytochrome b/b6 domain-containing protein [Alphaproteobacteria bacterium]
MKTIQFIRAYHAVLAISAILAYVTGEMGLIHAWLGYGVAGIIVLRLVSALTGARQLGLEKFYPNFEGLQLGNALTHPVISRVLLLGIAVSLTLAVITGILMDNGKSIGLAEASIVTEAFADDEFEYEGSEHHDENEFFEEIHEFFANMMLLFVGVHVTYLLLFKQPLAKFMLFMKR